MMAQTNYKFSDIEEVPLGTPFFRDRVAAFLQSCGLRYEKLDSYYAIEDTDGNIVAGAGLAADVIKCVAVKEELRSEGLMVPLISRIVSRRGNLKVFTKPEYRAVFESLGFRLLASAPKAVLLENGRGLEQYCARIRAFASPGRAGVIVMNANPFTLGHRYLIDKALEQVPHLLVIPVLEDVSMFSYKDRLEMICRGVADISEGDVDVLEGSPYAISAATFPTYFLKELSDASEQQMRLDLDLFARHIAPALGTTVRFVGSEPSDHLTARYNELMKEILPAQGVEVVEIPRLEGVSASAVREALSFGRYADAIALTPGTTHPYLLAELAAQALRMELDTPLKPGLVGPDSCGAHKDMDYGTMLRGISALRPYFVKIARLGASGNPQQLRQLGIDAENAMIEATGGVNTHRGAIFALGLALAAWGQSADNEALMQSSLGELARGLWANSKKLSNLAPRGAMAIALEGYGKLFTDWLPYYRALKYAHPYTRIPDEVRWKTLLRIMSTLDDTCVIKRAGAERAAQVKEEAGELLENFSTENLEAMCRQYAAEGISPGGAADMLSLTILMDSLL